MRLQTATLIIVVFSTSLFAGCYDSRRVDSKRSCDDFDTRECEFDPVGSWRATDYCFDDAIVNPFADTNSARECENFLSDFDVDLSGHLEFTRGREMNAELSMSLYVEFSISNACAVAIDRPALPREFCLSEMPFVRVGRQNAFLGEPVITDNRNDCDLSAEMQANNRDYSVIDNRIYYAQTDSASRFCVADNTLSLGFATGDGENREQETIGSPFIVFIREE
jgi:hypothetical protein